MHEVSTIGLDIAKQVFQVHAADSSGAVLFSKKIARTKLLGFFASMPALPGCYGGMRRRPLLGSRACETWP